MSDVSFNKNYVLLPRELGLLKGNCKIAKPKATLFPGQRSNINQNPSSRRSTALKLIFYFIILDLFQFPAKAATYGSSVLYNKNTKLGVRLLTGALPKPEASAASELAMGPESACNRTVAARRPLFQ